jgi:hypothetical protein
MTTDNLEPIKNAEIAILDCLERFSQRQMSTHLAGVESLALDGEKDLSADHWVASVLLNTTKAQVLLRVHFSSAAGRAILATASSEDAKAIQPTSAHDFLKEFCNVVMGKIKGILVREAGKDEAQKVFLPSIEPSYDRYGRVPDANGQALERRWWRLKWAEGEILLFARATATLGFTAETMEGLSKTGILMLDDGGEVEFL